MKLIRLASIGLTALACASLPAIAVAQDQRCISRSESQAVVAHLMPSLISSAQKRCAPQVGNRSYLSAQGPALVSRMTPLSRETWPDARRALERQSGNPLPDNEALLNFGRQAIADGVANGMDADSCRMVDQLLEQLAPLPPRNLANVFALFLETGVNNSRNSPLRVCTSPQG